MPKQLIHLHINKFYSGIGMVTNKYCLRRKSNSSAYDKYLEEFRIAEAEYKTYKKDTI
jgi:hypothetical protein